jgi:C4-dicarboxylate-specific signal transduction histidine kinase
MTKKPSVLPRHSPPVSGRRRTLHVTGSHSRLELQRELQAVLQRFSRTVSSSFNLASGLETFCERTNRLLGAGRTSVWLHDRNAREMVLEASSDQSYLGRGGRIPTDDLASPAVALRHNHADIVEPIVHDHQTLVVGVTVPLKGRRRALGTLVVERVRLGVGTELDLLAVIEETAGQLAATIENVQLLDGVLRSHRELVARAITPRDQLEAEHEQLRTRLTQSEKLAALGQLVAGIAHELNNPLQGVLGHLELLRGTNALPRSLQRDVRIVYREADRAAKIIRNLLVFAGSRKPVRQSVSVNEVVSRIFTLRAPAWRTAHIEVVRQFEKLPQVQGDPVLLQQALFNVVTNAEQALDQIRGGRIEIATVLEPVLGMIIVTVRDTGNGIPPDVLPRIFEPFYTTKEVGKGIGLGLAIAYGIVQEHGGEILAANHPAGGAMFRIALPVPTNVTRRARQASHARNELHGGGGPMTHGRDSGS